MSLLKRAGNAFAAALVATAIMSLATHAVGFGGPLYAYLSWGALMTVTFYFTGVRWLGPWQRTTPILAAAAIGLGLLSAPPARAQVPGGTIDTRGMTFGDRTDQRAGFSRSGGISDRDLSRLQGAVRQGFWSGVGAALGRYIGGIRGSIIGGMGGGAAGASEPSGRSASQLGNGDSKGGRTASGPTAK